MHPTQTQSVLRSPAAFTFALLGCIFCTVCLTAQAQEKITGAQKFDEFGDLRTDDVQALLDRFAKQVVKDQNLEAFIVFYRPEDILPGSSLREIYGFHEYLVNSLGVDPRRLKIVDGGISEKPINELWLVPSGTKPPSGPVMKTLPLDAPIQFDRLQFGPGCESEYTLVLEEPGDALKFFAGALRDNLTLKGFVLVRPAEKKSRKAGRLATSSKQILVKRYDIKPNRIVTGFEGRRFCSELDLWLAPSELVIPKNQKIGLFFQSQLMAKAEQNHYILRRIEFIGNEHTRDQTLRQRTLGLKEGEVFKKAELQQSLASLSRVKSLKFLSLSDVDVRLNSREKEIYISILVRERRHRT